MPNADLSSEGCILQTSYLYNIKKDRHEGKIVPILLVKCSVKSELDEFSKKINTIITEKVEENMKPLKGKVELSEAEMVQKDDRIKTLKSIVINQQRSLSQIDYEKHRRKRKTNIISGLTEKNITIDGIVYNTDEDKDNKNCFYDRLQ